jgi:hypothetical protein
MTSLGFLQYSEINEESSISNLTEIEKKKQARHNITIKKRSNANSGNSANSATASTNSANPNGNEENVQNMLKLINNTNGYDDNTGSDLADFNPPPRAEVSSKAAAPAPSPNRYVDDDYEKPTTVIKNNIPENDNIMAAKPRQYPMPLDTQEGFNSLPKTYATDYYKQYVPYFNQVGSHNNDTNNRDQLLEKLNYMIHLLEEQKDEKTGHVMEEIILYSFLGVFIIFIIDSFARAGKYTR